MPLGHTGSGGARIETARDAPVRHSACGSLLQVSTGTGQGWQTGNVWWKGRLAMKPRLVVAVVRALALLGFGMPLTAFPAIPTPNIR